MTSQYKLTHSQLNSLTRFVAKHEINEIELNKAETLYLFGDIENHDKLEKSRILLQPAFAEAYMRNSHGDMVILIIHRPQLLETDDIVWEDGYDDRDRSLNENHFNPFLRKLFEIFCDKMGLDLLLEKLAEKLNIRYPISTGQAKALIIKYIDLPQDSGTRSFLHDLRRKIRKYQDLIAEFQEYVLDNEQPKLIPFEYLQKVLQSGELSNLDSILKDVPDHWLEETQVDITTFQSGIAEPQLETPKKANEKMRKRFYLQDIAQFEFVCQECDYTQELSPDQYDNDFVETPVHHGKHMIVKPKHLE